MPWQTEMGRVLRYLVNDLDPDNPVYDDDRIEETIVVGAQLLQGMVDYYYQLYVVDVQSVTISPDPVSPVKEDGFVNLVCIQAAILILGGELKAAALQSVKVVDGPSQIDFTDVVRNKKIIYTDMKDRFNKALYQYRAGNSIAGHAILTPYTYNNIPGSFLHN